MQTNSSLGIAGVGMAAMVARLPDVAHSRCPGAVGMVRSRLASDPCSEPAVNQQAPCPDP